MAEEEASEPEIEAPAAGVAAQDSRPVAAEQGEALPAGEQPEAGEGTAAPDLSAELRAAEEVAAEQVEAVLTAALDRLGSAHHRPFSRP